MPVCSWTCLLPHLYPVVTITVCHCTCLSHHCTWLSLYLFVIRLPDCHFTPLSKHLYLIVTVPFCCCTCLSLYLFVTVPVCHTTCTWLSLYPFVILLPDCRYTHLSHHLYLIVIVPFCSCTWLSLYLFVAVPVCHTINTCLSMYLFVSVPVCHTTTCTNSRCTPLSHFYPFVLSPVPDFPCTRLSLHLTVAYFCSRLSLYQTVASVTVCHWTRDCPWTQLLLYPTVPVPIWLLTHSRCTVSSRDGDWYTFWCTVSWGDGWSSWIVSYTTVTTVLMSTSDFLIYFYDFNNVFGTYLKGDNHFVIVTWLFALVIQTIAWEKTPTRQGK